jgi:hypothetical protein
MFLSKSWTFGEEYDTNPFEEASESYSGKVVQENT